MTVSRGLRASYGRTGPLDSLILVEPGFDLNIEIRPVDRLTDFVDMVHDFGQFLVKPCPDEVVDLHEVHPADKRVEPVFDFIIRLRSGTAPEGRRNMNL